MDSEQPEVHPAHANDPEENPLDHVGEEISDPWDDESQTDWPNEVVGVD